MTATRSVQLSGYRESPPRFSAIEICPEIAGGWAEARKARNHSSSNIRGSSRYPTTKSVSKRASDPDRGSRSPVNGTPGPVTPSKISRQPYRRREIVPV